MRQAINNLQSTWSGFGFVSGTNVFKVCDQPHPILIQKMLRSCEKGDIDAALKDLTELWDQGYSAVDIVTTIFRVVKQFNECVAYLCHDNLSECLSCRLPEYTKLEFIKVNCGGTFVPDSHLTNVYAQEIGWTHMRILEGVSTLVQLAGLIARLCKIVCTINFLHALVC